MEFLSEASQSDDDDDDEGETPPTRTPARARADHGNNSGEGHPNGNTNRYNQTTTTTTTTHNSNNVSMSSRSSGFEEVMGSAGPIGDAEGALPNDVARDGSPTDSPAVHSPYGQLSSNGYTAASPVDVHSGEDLQQFLIRMGFPLCAMGGIEVLHMTLDCYRVSIATHPSLQAHLKLVGHTWADPNLGVFLRAGSKHTSNLKPTLPSVAALHKLCKTNDLDSEIRFLHTVYTVFLSVPVYLPQDTKCYVLWVSVTIYVSQKALRGDFQFSLWEYYDSHLNDAESWILFQSPKLAEQGRVHFQPLVALFVKYFALEGVYLRDILSSAQPRAPVYQTTEEDVAVPVSADTGQPSPSRTVTAISRGCDVAPVDSLPTNPMFAGLAAQAERATNRAAQTPTTLLTSAVSSVRRAPDAQTQRQQREADRWINSKCEMIRTTGQPESLHISQHEQLRWATSVTGSGYLDLAIYPHAVQTIYLYLRNSPKKKDTKGKTHDQLPPPPRFQVLSIAQYYDYRQTNHFDPCFCWHTLAEYITFTTVPVYLPDDPKAYVLWRSITTHLGKKASDPYYYFNYVSVATFYDEELDDAQCYILFERPKKNRNDSGRWHLGKLLGLLPKYFASSGMYVVKRAR